MITIEVAEKDAIELLTLRGAQDQLKAKEQAILDKYARELEDKSDFKIKTKYGTFVYIKDFIQKRTDYGKLIKEKGIPLDEVAKYTKASAVKAHVKFEREKLGKKK